ncbi:MAG: branched-chain amino acid ABC transporter permease [Alphaproteobacteria bacterium]
MSLLFEQVLNGLQFGIMLFLLSAGLTLTFGIMGLINLAHGSLYMIGAYVAASIVAYSGSFFLAGIVALLATGILGIIIEILIMRRLYLRHHLDQVLATFGLILFANEAMAWIYGRQPLFMEMPETLSGAIEILPSLSYPFYRLVIIAVGLVIAVSLHLLIQKTRLGMQIRAGATHREIIAALGVNIKLLYTAVFGLGALLAGLAGVMAGPLLSVQTGMGENILIQSFVVVIVGGLGSLRGAFAGALLVGLTDTLARAYLPGLLKRVMDSATASSLGVGLASIAIYILMAAILIWRPRGLFPTHA